MRRKMLNESSLIVVSGGNGLIGSAIVNAIRDQGAKAVVLDIATPNSKSDNEYYVQLPSKFSENQLMEAVKLIYDKYGKVSGLINCIATRTQSTDNFFATFDDYQEEIWNEVIHGNLTQCFLITRAFAMRMKEIGTGSIVNFGSIYGTDFGPDLRIYSEVIDSPMNTPIPYAVSKGGVVALTKYLATTLASFGIRVNSISPGGVLNNQPNEFILAYSNRVPMGRMATAEEIAGLPIFLVSDQASYITGQNIYIDGGLSAW